MPNANGQVMAITGASGGAMFVFSVNTATYDTLQRSDEWRWQALERLGNRMAEQFLGWGSTTITLQGSIYPLRIYGGVTTNDNGSIRLTNGKIVGTNQLSTIRAIADQHAPVSLVDGAGKNYGQFVILKVTELQSAILDNGKPRKQEFTIDLRSYAGNQAAPAALVQGSPQDLVLPPLPTSSPLVDQLQGSGRAPAAQTLGQLKADGATNGDGLKITDFLDTLNQNNGGQLQKQQATSPLAPTVANLKNPSDAAKAQMYISQHEQELQAGADYMKQQQDFRGSFGVVGY